jgi:phenylalanyl-tRNA synthetase beta chain
MKFSEAWLREWVDPPLSTQQLAEQLTMAGLEVDSVSRAAPELEALVIGEIIAVEPHPGAERLQVCRVDIGQAEPLAIVCGAPNARPGLRVPTALVGARLPGGREIQNLRIQGVESEGMLCSAAELDLAEDSAGILELPEDAPKGADLSAWLALDDQCIELDLTPNRGDCLSIAGVAREVAALNRLAARGPQIRPVASSIDETLAIALRAPADCPRYVGRVIRDVSLGTDTPLWMRERLRRSGMRSLGPVVDVTNYVLLELGQPMHAFDLEQLRGEIRVRRARRGEALRLLNGQSIALDDEVLVIADEQRPLALAGIMGGADSAVAERTQTLFLESAFFTPTSIIGRARKYGLQSDSSHRFERGVDPALQRTALERATELLLANVGGQAGPVIEVVVPAHMPQPPSVRLRRARIRRVLGVEMEDTWIIDMLQRIGMRVEGSGDEWRVHPPSHRFDIVIEEDLIEEAARLFGYDALPSTGAISAGTICEQPEGVLDPARTKQVLVDRGYQEAVTYSFVDPNLQRRFDPDVEAIALSNPISADMSVMRTSLWPGLVQALIYNLHRQQARVRLFEQGLRFARAAGEVAQEPVLAGAVSGPVAPEQWAQPTREVDFFDIKGDVEALLALTACPEQYHFVPGQRYGLHPGQAARIERNGRPIGWVGQLNPELQTALGLAAKTFLFELLQDDLHSTRVPCFEALSKFPAIRRDIAIVVDETVSFRSVSQCIAGAATETLREVFLFDLYHGPGLGPGRKSLALGLILQDLSRTLIDSEVDTIVARIVEELRQELGGTLRE